jgi:hypothetical protein
VPTDVPSKICCTCKRPKPLSEYNKRSRSTDGLQLRCRECSREWYEANRTEHIANVARRTAEVREMFRERLALFLVVHPCIDCGERDIRCLDFDHVDPTSKAGNISAMLLWPVSWKRIEAELAKCVVRCANCHRRKTAADKSFWRHRFMDRYGLLLTEAELLADDGAG